MDSYFPIILTQNLLLCMGTICFIYRCTVLTKKEKMAFYLCLYIGIIVALCEMISTMCFGKPNLIWLQTTANILNIGLTPLLPAIPLLIIGQSRIARITALIPFAFNLIMLLTGRLFTIDAQGIYERNPLFWTFMAVYLFNMFLLTYRSLVFSKIHQNHNVISLVFICLFMISSTTIQLRLPQIHISWFCVTVTTLLYFNYYTDTIQQMDNLTGLLNRNAFQDYSTRCREKISGIMLIDLDDFKAINDNYGHLTGDQYLITFAVCLRRVFQHSGYCYRLGGDEFCILLEKRNARLSPEALAKALRKNCDRLQNLPEKLSFSFGYRVLDDDMEISEAIDLADKEMYAAKAAHKRKRMAQ